MAPQIHFKAGVCDIFEEIPVPRLTLPEVGQFPDQLCFGLLCIIHDGASLSWKGEKNGHHEKLT